MSMRTSLRNANLSFPNTILIQGQYVTSSILVWMGRGWWTCSIPCNVGWLNDRWHEHDVDEIQQHAETCIEEAIQELERAGWAKECVRVVGESAGIFTWSLANSVGQVLIQLCYHRNYESTRNDCRLESQDWKTIVQGYCLDWFTHEECCHSLRAQIGTGGNSSFSGSMEKRSGGHWCASGHVGFCSSSSTWHWHAVSL